MLLAFVPMLFIASAYYYLTIISESILFASIAGLGLMIAFYYALTGYAGPIYYRRDLTKTLKNFVFIGLSRSSADLDVGLRPVRA